MARRQVGQEGFSFVADPIPWLSLMMLGADPFGPRFHTITHVGSL